MNIDDESKSALPAWVCLDDAEEQTERLFPETDTKQLEIMQDLKAQAENIYICKKVWFNLKPNVASIKIERADGVNNLAASLALKEWAESVGFNKTWLKKSNSVVFKAKRLQVV